MDDSGLLTVMVTGHRTLAEPALVRERLGMVIAKLSAQRDMVAVSGGAQGADSLWAQAALDAQVPFDLFLPNRWYRNKYPNAVSERTVAAARTVVHVVDRPDVADWSARWGSQRWWTDNFTRNVAMVDVSEMFVVVSPSHPRDLAVAAKGGTAATVKVLARRSATVIWVPDRADVEVCKVRLSPPVRAGASVTPSML